MSRARTFPLHTDARTPNDVREWIERERHHRMEWLDGVRPGLAITGPEATLFVPMWVLRLCHFTSRRANADRLLSWDYSHVGGET